MIGFSDVQELVSLFKIFALRKGHLRETKKRCSRSNTTMRSKAEWFRAQNSAYRSVATSLPSNSLLVARAGNVELDRYPQLMLPGAEIR